MAEKKDGEEVREEFAKGGRAKWAQKYDPSIKGSAAQKSGARPVLPGYKKDETGKIVPADGYPKWAKDNTSTVPDDPSNQINRAKGEPQKAAPSVRFNKAAGTKTINDGTTDVVTSHMNQEAPRLGNLAPEKQHYPPCINPTCKSFGKSHPNCLCYAGPGGSSLEQGHFAEGGKICFGEHKDDCEHFADGGQIQEQYNFLNNPADALDHVAAHHGLLHVLTKLGKSKSEDPHKSLQDYVEASRHGRKKVDGHISSLIGNGKLDVGHDKEAREALKVHLSELQTNPQNMINIGGNIGDSLPVHAETIGSKAVNAVNYLNGLKPQRFKNGPLSNLSPPDPLAEAKYNRHLDLANNPSLILQHAKDGTLGHQDLTTLNTLYPALAQSMRTKAYAAIVDAKEKGQQIPYKQRMGLSSLIGEPLDYTITPQAMVAIIQANGGAQTQQQQKEPKKASGVELKQINKTNELAETPTQTRLSDKKS